MDALIFNLTETKKHSGKYTLIGTENDPYPTAMYFKKIWFPNEKLPMKVQMTVEAVQ